MTEHINHALVSGTMIAEYRIEKLLGEGGFGLTYLVFDTNLHKLFAVKEYLPIDFAIRSNDATVNPRTVANEDAFQWGLDAFTNEARTLAKFQHPHIVQVYRYFEANGTAYIVMEFVEGRTLAQTINEVGRLEQVEAMAILLPIMDGLAEVHEEGILHRDIKPDNILIRDNGKPVLIDFGAARQALGAKSRSITTILTPGYAPLEQYSSKGDVGCWSDVYSLAAVAYYCVTKTRPDDASNRVINDELISVATLAKNQGSNSFLVAIDKGLAILPQGRPQTLDEWVGLLKLDSPHPQQKPDQLEKPASAPKSNKEVRPRSPEQKEIPVNNSIGVENSAIRSPLVWGLLTVVLIFAGTIISMLFVNTSNDPQIAAPTTSPSNHDTIPDSAPQQEPSVRQEQESPVGRSGPPATPIVNKYPINITTEPANANIYFTSLGQQYIDGLRLISGRYPIQISLPGYQTVNIDITVLSEALHQQVTLQRNISVQEQRLFDRASRTHSIADLETYLVGFPQGVYAEQVQAWLLTAQAQEIQTQQKWASCRTLPNKPSGLTGRAFFDMGSITQFKLKLGRFTVQDTAIQLVPSSDPHRQLCTSRHCYEVRGKFGMQNYTVNSNGVNLKQGKSCFYYLESTPHIIRLSPN